MSVSKEEFAKDVELAIRDAARWHASKSSEMSESGASLNGLMAKVERLTDMMPIEELPSKEEWRELYLALCGVYTVYMGIRLAEQRGG